MRHSDHVFVVRIWRETPSAGADWRGSAEHVESRQRLHFTKYADLIDFIALRSAELEEPGGERRERSPY